MARFLIQGIIHKNNIPERVVVDNIIPRNVNVNLGAAEVDKHISRDNIFEYVIFSLLYQTLFLYTLLVNITSCIS